MNGRAARFSYEPNSPKSLRPTEGPRDAARGSPDGFVLAASALRHLVTDPLLPPELEPEGWPARHLRTAYGSYLGDYQAGLRAFFRRHTMSDASVPRVEGHGPTMTP